MWGGMESYALGISSALAARGHNVCVFTRDVRAIDSRFAAAGIKVRHAPLAGRFDIATALSLASYLRRRKGDRFAIHVHHYRNAFVALLARKLARLSPHECRVIVTNHRCRPAREGRLMRRVYRNVDAMVFVSALTRRRFLSRWREGVQPFPAARMHVLHPVIAPSRDGYLPPPEKGPFNLLYLGRLSPEKGLERLIGAMVRLKGKRVRLTVAGTGYADYAASLRRLAVSLGVDSLIDWKGFVEDTRALACRCHAGIFVSQREEPFSLASIELMACGRTQIIPPGGAFPEWLAPAEAARLAQIPERADSVRLSGLSEAGIALAVEALAADRDLTATLGRNALDNWCRHPGEEQFIDTLCKLYAGD